MTEEYGYDDPPVGEDYEDYDPGPYDEPPPDSEALSPFGGYTMEVLMEMGRTALRYATTAFETEDMSPEDREAIVAAQIVFCDACERMESLCRHYGVEEVE